MQENNKPLQHLELLHEMNRLFLSALQTRVERGQDRLGLPSAVAPLLAGARAELLDRAAALPHALFRLELDAQRAADAPLERDSAAGVAQYCLQISLLHSARNLCRLNGHLAQTFLGMPASSLIRLRCLVLIELVNLAESPRLISAAFADEPRLWHEMLSPDSSADQRSLRLIALQPRAADLLPLLEHGALRAR